MPMSNDDNSLEGLITILLHLRFFNAIYGVVRFDFDGNFFLNFWFLHARPIENFVSRNLMAILAHTSYNQNFYGPQQTDFILKIRSFYATDQNISGVWKHGIQVYIKNSKNQNSNKCTIKVENMGE